MQPLFSGTQALYWLCFLLFWQARPALFLGYDLGCQIIEVLDNPSPEFKLTDQSVMVVNIVGMNSVEIALESFHEGL